MIQKLRSKSLGVFALTALPVAIVTAFVVSNAGTAETKAAAFVAESGAVTTTTSPLATAPPATEVLATTTTTTIEALEISEAPVAVSNEALAWKRIPVDQCHCSAEFPWPTSQSDSSLPDGRPAHLVLSQSNDSVISAALWVTTASVESDRTEELVTVLNAIAGGAQLQNQTNSSNRIEATLVDGTTKAKIDIRSVGDKLVVLFIASSNGEGLGAASTRYLASFNA